MIAINKAQAETIRLHGLKKIPGEKDNPAIVELFHELGHKWVKHDEVAWCAALMGAKLQKYGYQVPELKKNLRARAYLEVNQVIENPVFGWDYVVFWRGLKDGGVHGHVAWFIGFEGVYVKVLGGNQSNQISFALYPKSKVLGYVRPVQIKF